MSSMKWQQIFLSPNVLKTNFSDFFFSIKKHASKNIYKMASILFKPKRVTD